MTRYAKTMSQALVEMQEVKKITKRERDELENDNQHGELALRLAQSFGTPQEVKKIKDINKRHMQRGSIDPKDQKERDAISNKYYKMAEDNKYRDDIQSQTTHENDLIHSKEEVELDEANYRVTYSTKGKLFSKKIRAKSEDEAEDIFVKQFKDKKIPIDADDIRSVVKEGYEGEVLKILDDAGIDGYFKMGKLYVSRRDAKDAKKALDDSDEITKLPKMVMEEVELDEDSKMAKQSDDNLKSMMKKMRDAEKKDPKAPSIQHMIKRIEKEMKKRGLKEGIELDEKYDLYHKSFSDAMQHAYDYAKKKMGITVDPKEIDSKVATGPKKPSEGKTNTYRLKGKGGNLQIQVYNKGGSKPFELNMYKEEVVYFDENDKRIDEMFDYVLIDKDNKIVGRYSGKDAKKNAQSGMKSAHLPPMRIPKNEVGKMKIIPISPKDKKGIGDMVLAIGEELEMNEGKMKQMHQMMDDGKTAEEIAKALKLDLKSVKALMKEGMWAMASTPKEVAALKKLMQRPIPVGDPEKEIYTKEMDALYGLLGDDELFDMIGELGDKKGAKADARPVIMKWFAQRIKDNYGGYGERTKELAKAIGLKKIAAQYEEGKLDKVNPTAVKKKFDDRKDKDIDNDGDVDDSDKFLHKRRKAVSKAIKSEGRYFPEKQGSLMSSILDMWRPKLDEKIEYVEYDFKNKNDAMQAKRMLDAIQLMDLDINDDGISTGMLTVDAGDKDMTKYHKEIMKKYKPRIVTQEKKDLTKNEKDDTKKMTDTGKPLTPVDVAPKMPKMKNEKNRV